METLSATVDFERCRPILEKAAGRPRGKKGGPALDAVLKFKMLLLQSFHGLSLAATGKMVRDHLSWMRFCGLDLNDKVPDANTLWDFREALTGADALDALFGELNRMINAAGFISRSGQLVDASIVAALRWRATEEEKAARKDTDARWTVKHRKAKAKPNGRKLIDIVVPVYGYKSHIRIDRMHGIIRRQIVTDAAAQDGDRLREGLINRGNT